MRQAIEAASFSFTALSLNNIDVINVLVFIYFIAQPARIGKAHALLESRGEVLIFLHGLKVKKSAVGHT